MNWTHLSSADGQLPIPPANTGQSGLRVVDLDENGQLDYVLTLWDAAQTLVWYRHSGTSFVPYVIDTQTPNLSHGERFEDIDRDGDIDLLFGDASHGNQMYWWENPYPVYDPNVPWARRLVRSTGGNFYHDNIWADFDADGQDELISWNQYGNQLLLFEVPADPRTSGPWPATAIFTWTGPVERYKGTDAADIDLDGTIDFLGGCGWFHRTNTGSFTFNPINDAMGYSMIKAGQLIPGGRPEVVCLLELETGPLKMYHWTGTSWLGKDLLTQVPPSHTLQIGDVNGDGLLDIMTAEMAQPFNPPPTNPNAAISILYGDGLGNFTRQIVFQGQGDLEGQLADIDNDGDLDIVAKPFRHNAPRVDIYLNERFAPVIVPDGGSFPGQVTVSLSSRTGDAIYYSTDGSAPDTHSILYAAPFTLNADATVKAVSAENGVVLGGAGAAAFQIVPDASRPAIVAAYATGGPPKVTILFNEPVEPVSAQIAANYSIDQGVGVISASLDGNSRSVTLVTSPLSQAGTYTVSAHGVTDRSMPPNSVAPGTHASFSYRDFPQQGLALWFKADTGAIRNGASVSQWRDLTSAGHHATQPLDFAQPSWVEGAINAWPVLKFDGVNDILSFPLPINGLNGMSLFLVAANTQDQSGGGSQSERAALFWNETAPWGTVYLSPFQSKVNMRFGTTQTGNRIEYARPSPVGAAFNLTSAVKDGTTDSLYLGGTLAVSQGGKLPTIAGTRDAGQLGRGYNDDTYFAGQIAEVLVYTRALGAAERQQVESYLKGKYGLTTFGTPQILTQPADAAVEEPQGAVFAVQAGGAAPLTYQWRRNGSAIAGANGASYALASTTRTAENGAQFDVVVSNAVGTITSRVATLTVTPSPIPTAGLALWLRGDRGTVTNGSAMTQWTDQSGNNRHATQSGPSNQPSLRMQGVNGWPVVRFDGLDDSLSFTLPVNGLSSMSLFLVAANTQNQTGGGSQSERAALFWNETGYWGTVYLSPFQSRVNARFGTAQAGNLIQYTRGSSVGASFTLSSSIKNGSTDSFYVNGALAVSEAGKLQAIAATRDTGQLGRGFNDNTYFAGEIAEVLVFTRALTATERRQVDSYLLAKYGLAQAAPGEATALRWCPASKTCLMWDPASPPAGYRVHRGTRASLAGLANGSVDSCVIATFAAPSTGPVLGGHPPAGSMEWYLVVPTGCAGEGPAGSGTFGPRVVNASGDCSAGTCADGLRNGGEADTDCGGACPPCASGLGCCAGTECATGACMASGASTACSSTTCADGTLNGGETDTDCGGGICTGCSNGQLCLAGRDCQSGICQGGICRAALNGTP